MIRPELVTLVQPPLVSSISHLLENLRGAVIPLTGVRCVPFYEVEELQPRGERGTRGAVPGTLEFAENNR